MVWAVEGDAAPALVEPLKTLPAVLSVAAFGNALHVAGRDEAALDRAIAPWRDKPGLRWHRTEANLEDVFIGLIGQAQDNYTQKAAS